jgi:hypothetical protein
MEHLQYNEDGILVPTINMPKQFLIYIYNYFNERNEDEYYDLIKKN